MEVYVAWGEGYLLLKPGGRGLQVLGENLRLDIALREIAFKAPFETLEEVPQDKRGESKIAYIRLAFPIKGFSRSRGRVLKASSDFSIGPYGVSYTLVEGVGGFITIHPPPGSLYKAITIGDDVIAVYMIGRRQVYMMEEDGERRIILV